MTSTVSRAGAISGNPPKSPILPTSALGVPTESPDPERLLIDWSEVDRFLQLLGRSADSVDALLFPPKEGPGSDKGAKKLKLDKAGRQSVEQFLAMPLYRFHSLGIRPNPGGAKASEITAGIALWFEADGGLPLEAQEALPELLGMPEPTVSVWSAHRSLHCYWVAEEDQGLPPAQWKKAQERLIAAVKEVSPEAGVDEAIKDPSRVMRAAGGIHPATGERARIHSEGGKRYNLNTLWDIIDPKPEYVIQPEKSDAEQLKGFERMLDYMGEKINPWDCHNSLIGWKEGRGEKFHAEWLQLLCKYCSQESVQVVVDIDKALTALSFLPPNKFSSYEEWLKVGMALHSLVPEAPKGKSNAAETCLWCAWREWSRKMDGYYPHNKDAPGVALAHGDELNDKWKSFSTARDSSIGLGSLIHWAKAYGYRPSGGADTASRYTAAPSLPSAPSLPTEGPSVESKDGSRRALLALSVQERMRILRDRAEELVEDEATPLLDRLPVMRDEASKLDLPTRDSDLQKILWGARRALAAPAEAITTGGLLDFTPIPWCWEGLLMREAINLLIAAPKVGKTSLLIAAIAAWYRGESFLGKRFYGECPPVLIVGSDQPQSDWGRMLQRVGLVSEERRLLEPIVGLFHASAPLALDVEGIEKIAAYAKEHPGLLVVIDSYARCVASLGLSERDAEIAGPLADLQEAVAPYGATIVGIHHANKGGHESASMASRGSSALPALASQLIHLTRLEQGQEGSMGGKRMLTTEGRGGAPEKMLLELSEEGRWLFRGDGDALLQEQERQRTIDALNDRQASALEHVEETWEGTKGGQGVSADLLASLMELRGADTSRTARRLLEQLRERGLVRKVVKSEGKDRALVARYIPTASPRWESPSADSVDAIPAGADGKDGADGPAVTREPVSLPLQEPSMDSKDAEVGEFESVQTFQNGQWSNGWMVEKCTKTLAGTFFSLFREDDPSQVASLHQSFVRPCTS
jgi:hypothetical protein